MDGLVTIYYVWVFACFVAGTPLSDVVRGLDAQGLDLLSKLLQLVPEQRLTAQEVRSISMQDVPGVDLVACVFSR